MNMTTPWVDQNQTYTSHASHQVFLREYMTGPDGKTDRDRQPARGRSGASPPGPTSRRRPRTMLGIDLTDADVGNIPLLRTDPYGNFIPRSADRLRRRSSSASAPMECSEHVRRHRDRGHPGEPGEPGERRPHRPRLPRRHRPCGRACRLDRAASSRPTATAPWLRECRRLRPASSTRADRRPPTTTSCSTPTTSRATAAATRTSA